jgi:hypothetical protein
MNQEEEEESASQAPEGGSKEEVVDAEVAILADNLVNSV